VLALNCTYIADIDHISIQKTVHRSKKIALLFEDYSVAKSERNRHLLGSKRYVTVPTAIVEVTTKRQIIHFLETYLMEVDSFKLF
jgi:hypothetical protein